MTPTELITEWGMKDAPYPVYYVYGTSEWRKTQVLRGLREANPKTESVDAAMEDYEKIGRGTLFGRQHFLLRNPHECKERKLVPILRQPAAKTYITILAAEKEPEFAAEIKEHAKVIQLNKPSAKAWPDWMRDRLKELGMEMTNSTIEDVLEETDDDEYARDTALKQIKAAGLLAPTTVEAIEIIATESHEPLWGIQEAIAENNWAKAKAIIRDQEEEPPVAAAIGGIAWKLWAVLVTLQEKLDEKDLRELVPLKPWQWKKLKLSAKGLQKRHTAEGMRKLMGRVMQTDRNYKRGKAEYWEEQILKAVAECTTGLNLQ